MASAAAKSGGTELEEGSEYICRDLGEFKRIIDKMRGMEDKILLRLNCELPTSSFSKLLNKEQICHDIQKQLTESRKRREILLDRCMEDNKQILRQLQNDPTRSKELKTINANLRLLKEESSVEEIIRFTADKALTDRCRKELLI